MGRKSWSHQEILPDKQNEKGATVTRRDAKGDHHSRRIDLAGEHRYGDAGQLAIAVLFAVVWIGDTFILGCTTFLNEIIPNSVRLPAALILLSLSAFLAIKGMTAVFGKIREKPVVIRTGVFGAIRHPIYLSEALLYLGLLMLSLSLAATFILVPVFIFLNHIARHEEKLCLRLYGDAYEQYMRDVPMWIPRFWKRKK
ncbi:isoprenylcysteine carboxylmethyltransferase family protein [bacterium]|nr:isoprenylcysteine carboxylmethyltransferase family protein [bacterium]